ncbi:phage minor capsid protein [Peribacillus butanolivorans]|uniref:phage minor capsid protein n=1 Tax=Peribacillus butanolivorans TaxID=421767 RepID=UPI00207CD88F|nr:phage minor capsid protein [Peribacillus butanolivorans]MCO0597382.1 phage minor capsid protein [Peribacillus butanolivorans]
MAEFKELPTPTYNYEVSILVGYYEKAMSSVSNELLRLGLTNFERAQVLSTQAEIKRILKELDGQATEWAVVNIEKAATDGVIRSLVALGLAESAAEAAGIVRFNKLNQYFVKTAVADTQSDLLKISKNVDDKVRIAIRQAVAESMRSNLTQGINGTASLKRDVLALLDEATKTGILDASSPRPRRWRPEVYAEMAVRTKMSRTHTEATTNDALGRNVLYGVISKHGAKDACAKWEGKIVKLVREAPGDYPYIGDLPRREIFHPNCRHLITPVRRPERE